MNKIDRKYLSQMNDDDIIKLIKSRKRNENICVKLMDNAGIYCTKCKELFTKHKVKYDIRGFIDDEEYLHCCDDCGDCHKYSYNVFCTKCNNCNKKEECDQCKTDSKYLDKMSDENKIKLRKLRKKNKSECITLLNTTKMYCMKCCETFKINKDYCDDRGCVDNDEFVHCCADCGDCHECDNAMYCSFCNECHDGSPNYLDLSYIQCPKCNACFSISLYSHDITCPECKYEFNYDD